MLRTKKKVSSGLRARNFGRNTTKISLFCSFMPIDSACLLFIYLLDCQRNIACIARSAPWLEKRKKSDFKIRLDFKKFEKQSGFLSLYSRWISYPTSYERIMIDKINVLRVSKWVVRIQKRRNAMTIAITVIKSRLQLQPFLVLIKLDVQREDAWLEVFFL